MREYLFRGKRVNTKEWVYGCLTQLQQDQVAIYDNRPCASSLQLWQYIQFHTYEVIPETVGQFTGLLDKNGVKIFEGDIVTVSPDCEKTWDKGHVQYGRYASFNVFLPKIGTGVSSPLVNFCKGTMGCGGADIYIKRIGNIYDNKELLND